MTNTTRQLHPQLGMLVDYIVQFLNDAEGTTARTRLAKLLYLFDVEYYRIHGRIFTGLQWMFLHYGPYDTALEPYLGSEKVETASGNTAYVAQPGDYDVSVDGILSNADRLAVDDIIRQWGLEDLPVLLDYVYFGTEPMEDVTRGAILDFSLVERATSRYPEPQAKHLRLSPEKRAEFRRRLARKREERKSRPRPRYFPRDAVYGHGMRLLNAEEQAPPATPIIEGVEVHISPEAAQLLREQKE